MLFRAVELKRARRKSCVKKSAQAMSVCLVARYANLPLLLAKSANGGNFYKGHVGGDDKNALAAKGL